VTRTHEVLIVVQRGDEYLVVHRSPENGGYWHQIAGGVEEGESPSAAAVRELDEETGLDADPVSIAQAFEYDGIHVDCFIAQAPPGWEPRLDWEHDDHRWLNASAAADLVYWPEPAAILRGLAS
jgi:8-oxo-dGTP pyrophosphatase MutT (NUDIX family)